MSWRVEIRQQLLQLRHRLSHHLRFLMGTWPGVITLTLVLLVLTAGLAVFAKISKDASAQSTLAPSIAQIATRVPTRRALTVATPTPVATATATLRPPTPTWTPMPTATQIALSPLLATNSLTATLTTTLTTTTTQTHVVPLPADRTGPQIVPVDVITASQGISATLTPLPTPEVTSALTSAQAVTMTGAVASTVSDTVTTTAAGDGLILLIPTPTPTPTLTIAEALEQPVASGGMAGIVATATAAMPPAQEVSSEAPAAEPSPAEPPVAEPTVASQPTPDGNTRTARVPILMYHYLSVPPANADAYRLDLSVTPELFAAHLDAIQQAGYTTISLYALLDHLMNGAPLPEKPVVLTFYDGYRDNYENAFPLLRERGLTATFFLVTDFINDQRPEYLTWDMVREMYAGGMSIEGHGRNHVSLANKDADYLIWQALGTYESIEHEIGVRPRFISYPAGEYDQRTIEIFSSASYWAGFTTKQGATHSSDDLFQLRRIRVRGSTSTGELLRVLALDW